MPWLACGISKKEATVTLRLGSASQRSLPPWTAKVNNIGSAPAWRWKKDGSHSLWVYFLINRRREPFLLPQPEGSEIKLMPLIRMFAA